MKKAFTLIELLIVVAIIAILAAIAVPNFLEAQTRSKVSRVKADMRTIATGLESYFVDNNAYPQSNGNGSPGWNPALSNVAQNIGTTPASNVLERLSTPVSYLTNGLLPDAFPTQRAGIPNNSTGTYASVVEFTTDIQRESNKYLKYAAVCTENTDVTAEVGDTPPRKAQALVFIYSSGPDNIKTELRGSGVLGTFGSNQAAAAYNNVYDPSNGTVSQGDVFRAAGQAVDDRGKFLFNAIQKQN